MNYSGQQILHVYKQNIKERSERLNAFKCATIKEAFGKYFINIDEVLTETGTEDLECVFTGHYGGLDFLGNINGKTTYQLYYKNHEIKKEIERLRLVIDLIEEETRSAIDHITKQHGQPTPQHAIIWDMAKN